MEAWQLIEIAYQDLLANLEEGIKAGYFTLEEAASELDRGPGSEALYNHWYETNGDDDD